MGTERYLGIALLLGLMVFANFAMFDLAERNGTFSLTSIFAFKDRTLPDSKIPVHIPQTGIAPVDNYVAFILSVFWVDLHPKNFLAHIHGWHFLGTLNASWILMLVETHRGRRSSGFYFATYFIEVVAELAGLGFFTPLWCIVHLLVTPTPSAKTPTEAERTLLPSTGNLGPLGYALMFGLVAPSLLMCLGKVDELGIFSQQVWTLVRLFHPVVLFAVWKLFVSIQGPVATNKSAGSRAATVRKFYTFSILASTIHHVMSLGLIFADLWIADWIKPDVYKAIHARSPILPFPFWQRDQIKPVTFNEGVSYFLQWDELLTGLAMIVWTAALYVETSKRKTTLADSTSVFLQSAFLFLIGGPLAAAAFLLQERDNVVLVPADNTSKKNN